MEASFFAGSIVILLFSVIVHEVMHGLAALHFGDHTAERAGRLTLNPIPHIDPIGTILVPALFLLPALLGGGSTGFIIGWAKPVPVNPLNFIDIRKGELVTSAAGILSNFALAIAAAIAYHLTGNITNPVIPALLAFTVNINLILAIFNSIPIPPLDGSKIIMSFLNPRQAASYQQLERYGLIILLLLLFIPFGPTTILGFVMGFFLNIFHAILGV